MGGLAIAAVSLALVIVTGKFMSITRGYASVCGFVSNLKYFQREELGGKFGFRTFFILGVTIGGFIAAVSGSGYNPTWSLGSFDAIWGPNLAVKAGVLTFGGALWGYGARMAKGCTSGNAISGLSQGSLSSLVATVGFLIAGVIVTFTVATIAGVK